jgi:hypothetical protein
MSPCCIPVISLSLDNVCFRAHSGPVLNRTLAKRAVSGCSIAALCHDRRLGLRLRIFTINPQFQPPLLCGPIHRFGECTELSSANTVRVIVGNGCLRMIANVHRMRIMMKIKRAVAGIQVFTMVSGGVALADCPHNMPTQLLEDCLIYDSEGESFPSDDYAHMDEYHAWLKTQQPTSPPDAASGSVAKNVATAPKLID